MAVGTGHLMSTPWLRGWRVNFCVVFICCVLFLGTGDPREQVVGSEVKESRWETGFVGYCARHTNLGKTHN